MDQKKIYKIAFFMAAFAGLFVLIRNFLEQIDASQKMSDKHLELFELMSKWVSIKQEGKNLSSYFEKKGYRRIAIYGMNYVGKALVNELTDSGIDIVFCVDQNKVSASTKVKTNLMSDKWEEVDAIVVTPVTFYDEIKDKLTEKVDCDIVAIDDILYEV